MMTDHRIDLIRERAERLRYAVREQYHSDTFPYAHVVADGEILRGSNNLTLLVEDLQRLVAAIYDDLPPEYDPDYPHNLIEGEPGDEPA